MLGYEKKEKKGFKRRKNPKHPEASVNLVSKDTILKPIRESMHTF